MNFYEVTPVQVLPQHYHPLWTNFHSQSSHPWNYRLKTCFVDPKHFACLSCNYSSDSWYLAAVVAVVINHSYSHSDSYCCSYSYSACSTSDSSSANSVVDYSWYLDCCYNSCLSMHPGSASSCSLGSDCCYVRACPYPRGCLVTCRRTGKDYHGVWIRCPCWVRHCW